MKINVKIDASAMKAKTQREAKRLGCFAWGTDASAPAHGRVPSERGT